MRMLPAIGVTALMFLSNAAIAPRAERVGATAQHAMVATAQHDATQVGVNILRAGGNAVDAAVAVGYALAVTDPCCGNVGGGGFMLIRLHDGRERFIDFRERAPLHATATMYLDARGNVVPNASLRGWLAVAVPGTVAGLETARRHFGTMSRERLIAPAILLARDGFVLTNGDELLPDGKTPPPGTRFSQPQLASTLELIAKDGPAAFYR
ncbi:MAG: gamma-glutamyltransferase, partial [Candidatus Cybelea sp.]